MAIEIKNLSQLKSMRKAGLVVADTLKLIKQSAQVGMTTLDLNDLAIANLTKHGATSSFLGYHGFPAVICASVNEELVHGLPTKGRFLKEGDIVSIDLGLEHDGWFADSAFTIGIGDIKENHKLLIEGTEKAFETALEVPNTKKSSCADIFNSGTDTCATYR